MVRGIAYGVAVWFISVQSAAADWQISRNKDPMNDDVSISHALTGERGLTYVFLCREQGGKVVMYAGGFHIPGASLVGDGITARVRFEGGTPEPLKVATSSKPDFVFVGEDSSDSSEFATKFRASRTVAIEINGQNNARYVDQFSPETISANKIQMIQDELYCLNRIVSNSPSQ